MTRIFRSSCKVCFLECEGAGVPCDAATIAETLRVAGTLVPVRKRKGVKRGKKGTDATGTRAVRQGSIGDNDEAVGLRET